MPAKKRRAARRPPHLGYAARMAASVRRNPVKFWITATAVLASIVPAVTGLNWLDQKTDPWQPALHQFVYDKLGASNQEITKEAVQNRTVLRDLQIDTANGKLTSTVNDIKKWQLELNKAQDDDAKELITKQISALQATKSKLELQLQTLEKLRQERVSKGIR